MSNRILLCACKVSVIYIFLTLSLETFLKFYFQSQIFSVVSDVLTPLYILSDNSVLMVVICSSVGFHCSSSDSVELDPSAVLLH